MLSLTSNHLYAGGGKALAEGLKGNQVITELNISNSLLGWTDGVGPDMSGVIALAGVIPDMGAMTSLNLSVNALGPEGAKHIAAGVKVTKCAIAVVLAPFLCHLTTG